MLDPLLTPFVSAATDAEADCELSLLLEQRAWPLARVIVARKLRTFGQTADGRDAEHEDAVSDAIVALVQRLRQARRSGEAASIGNFAGYTAAVVHSTCAHYIRRRYPERARLKNRLRYVLGTDSRLAIWTVDDDYAVCGRAAWRGRGAAADAGEALRRLAEARDARLIRLADMAQKDLGRAVADVFAAVAGPIELEAFVSAAAGTAGLAEPRQTDLAVVASPQPAVDVVLDRRRFLERVWVEVRELPLRQRLALLLNLRDGAGGGVLWLFPVSGVATVRQIAGALEIADAEFARLWPEIPLEDAAIAERLGCTRQQVINLRMSARKRLMNRIGARLGPFSERMTGTNLRRVSASLKGSA